MANFDTGLKVDTSGLRGLANLFDSPELKRAIKGIIKKREMAALIGQAIADNFAKEGPGWKPLKAATIRNSVSKATKRKLKNLNDKQLLHFEKIARSTGNPGAANRQILRRTGVLMKSVTVPNAKGNVFETSESGLIWGTSLNYAKIHNEGGTIQFPGTDKGFGEPNEIRVGKRTRKVGGVKIPPHAIPIDKREFLVIHKEWMDRINEWVFTQAIQLISSKITNGAK